MLSVAGFIAISVTWRTKPSGTAVVQKLFYRGVHNVSDETIRALNRKDVLDSISTTFAPILAARTLSANDECDDSLCGCQHDQQAGFSSTDLTSERDSSIFGMTTSGNQLNLHSGGDGS